MVDSIFIQELSNNESIKLVNINELKHLVIKITREINFIISNVLNTYDVVYNMCLSGLTNSINELIYIRLNLNPILKLVNTLDAIRVLFTDTNVTFRRIKELIKLQEVCYELKLILKSDELKNFEQLGIHIKLRMLYGLLSIILLHGIYNLDYDSIDNDLEEEDVITSLIT